MVSREPAPPRADVALASALAALGAAEVLGLPVGDDVVGGPVLLNLLTVLAYSAPLAWRRRWPLAVVLVVHAALGLRALQPEPLELYVPLFATLVSAYSLGLHGRQRELLPAAVGVAVALVVAQERGTGGDATPAAVPTLVLFAVLWLIGHVIGRRSQESSAALQRAEQLDRRRVQDAADAVAAERRRIAHDLHDAVSHSLAMIAMQAGGAQEVLDADPARAARSLRAIETAAREGVSEMRQLLGLIDDDPTPSRAPAPALDRLPALVEGARSSGVDVVVTTTGKARPLPAAVSASVYRIVQEALTNVARHGGRCAAEVGVHWSADALRVEVVNDVIVTTSPAAGSGRGLPGMRERAAVAGGRLEAGPRDDGRFGVVAVLPLEPTWP